MCIYIFDDMYFIIYFLLFIFYVEYPLGDILELGV